MDFFEACNENTTFRIVASPFSRQIPNRRVFGVWRSFCLVIRFDADPSSAQNAREHRPHMDGTGSQTIVSLPVPAPISTAAVCLQKLQAAGMPVSVFDAQRIASVLEQRPEVYTIPKPVDVFTGMTVDQMRNRCRGLRLSSIGKKHELQARLREKTKEEEQFKTPTSDDVDRMQLEELQSFLRGYLVSANGSEDVLRNRLKARIMWRNGFCENWDSAGHALPEMKVIPSEDGDVESGQSPKKLRRTTAMDAMYVDGAAGGYCSETGKGNPSNVQLHNQKQVKIEEKYDSICVVQKTETGTLNWQSSHKCSFKHDKHVWLSVAMIVNKHEGGFFYGEVWMPAGTIGVFRHELKINSYGFDDFQYTVSSERALVLVVTAQELRTMYAVESGGGTLMKTVYEKAKIDMIFLAVQNVGSHLFVEIFGGGYQKKIKENPVCVFASMQSSSVHLTYGQMRPIKALGDLLKPNMLSGGVPFKIPELGMLLMNPGKGDGNGDVNSDIDLNKSDEMDRLGSMPSLSHTTSVAAPGVSSEMPLPVWPAECGSFADSPVEWDEDIEKDMNGLFEDM